MPIVRMPDGTMVDMPDNPSPEQLAALERINTPQKTTVGGAASEMAKGLSRGLLSYAGSVGEGFSQLPQAKLANIVSQYITQRNGLQDPLQQSQQAAGGLMQQARQATQATPGSNVERMLGTGAELTGSMLPGLAGMPARSLAGAARDFIAPVVGGVVGEQVGGETGKAIGALGAPFAQHAAGRLLNPKVSKEVQMLVESGVRPTPGQIQGGALNKFEELPLIKEVTASSRNRAVDQFNQATINRALAPIGGKVDKIGFEGFAKADELAQAAYDKILPRLKIQDDFIFHKELGKIENAISVPGVRYELSEILNYTLKPYFKPTGKEILAPSKLSPEDMKRIDSTLGQLARLYGGDQAAEKRMLAEGLRDVQGSLRALVERQNPAYAEPLRNANQAWANLVRVERAVANAGKTEGVFSPAQFQQAVKAMDSSLRHRTFAKGKAVMQDWGQAGIKVLGDTPTPHVPYALLKNMALLPAAAGGAAMGGGAGAALLGGAGTLMGVYNPISQNALANALARRPDWAKKLGGIVAPTTPYALGTAPLFSQGEQ